jgi:hypothetical protein
MRRQVWVLVSAVSVFVACGSGSGGGGFTGDGGADGGSMDSTSQRDVLQLGDGSHPMSDGHCAAESFSAKAAPAAMLFVLDASGSMGDDDKYSNAQEAIVTAMNLTVFDTMSLGLLLYPQAETVAAMCPELFGLPVNCLVSGLPQVPLALAGPDTSDTTGVRRDIYQQLVASAPATGGMGNGNPIYDALTNGIKTLQAFTTGKRILFFITDGGASCTSQDTPQRPYYVDENGCDDWENPGNIVTLLGNANTDAKAPVDTLVVGLENSDPSDDPPYNLGLALSAYGLAGSPATVPASCDGTYTMGGGAPAIPCNFDLTTTPDFSTVLEADIEKVRNKLLGCTFSLPVPKSGTVDMNQVNVEYSVDGGKPVEIDRRASASDPCTSGAGCWDYNSMGQVELIGAACSAVEAGSSADVQILVGCQTIIK